MTNLTNTIFNKKKLNYQISRINNQDIPNYSEKMDILNHWINFIKSDRFLKSKETELQSEFLNYLFCNILDYNTKTQNNNTWNLNKEQLTDFDAKFADGALGYFTNDAQTVRVVIELKDPNKDLDSKQHGYTNRYTPIEQAFSYVTKFKDCRWVIVSNFNEIRLYNKNTAQNYEVFYISELNNEEKFKSLYFLLNKNNLISPSGLSVIDNLYNSNEADERNITKELYSAFKTIRLNFFEHLKIHNSGIDEIILIEKTQKLLDRFIFICFAEDNRLLPETIFKKMVTSAKSSFLKAETKIWYELQGLFEAINIGSPTHGINKFNGGLFATDEILDNLIIKDSILEELVNITEYDFESDIDVNILGHIFEQSISDIEEIKAGIEGIEYDKKNSKRKKEGIHYTPDYITKYIVENAIGGWLEDRKKELGYYDLPELTAEDYKSVSKVKDKSKLNENIKKHLDFWNSYRIVLMGIKVLDPACGSGAFLNQAFNFLYAEGQKVNDKIAELSGVQELFGLDKHILSDNLFGVDINSESVEITKLSLWLKTANKHSELTSLDNNIKCGNSLIDDPEVAGDKAFNWFKEFPSVFPGYRDYNVKYKVPDFEPVTYEEIKRRSLQEPEVQYSANPENISLEIKDSAFSYKPNSKGFQKHGFDVIIGNPPYVYLQPNSTDEYLFVRGNNNTYVAFIEKSLKLLKNNGFLGFIIPNTWFSGDNYMELRNYILNDQQLKQIIQLPYDIFEAYIDTSIVLISKVKSVELVGTFQYDIRAPKGIIDISMFNYFNVQHWIKYGKIFLNSDLLIVGNKVWFSKKNILLGKIASINRGSLPPHDNELSQKKNEYFNIKWFDEQVFRYQIQKDNLIDVYVNYGALRENKSIELFKKTKIIARQLMSRQFRMNLTFSDKEFAFKKNLYAIYDLDSNFNYKYILTILNSKLFSFCQVNFNTSLQRDDFPAFSLQDFKSFQVPNISLELQSSFITLADIMLEKNKELQDISKAFTEFIKGQFKLEKLSTKLQDWYKLTFEEFTKELEKAKIKLTAVEKFDIKPLFDREKSKALEIKTIIDQTDCKIDAMVYELYGLTYDEVKIVDPEFDLSREEYANYKVEGK